MVNKWRDVRDRKNMKKVHKFATYPHSVQHAREHVISSGFWSRMFRHCGSILASVLDTKNFIIINLKRRNSTSHASIDIFFQNVLYALH